MSAEDNKQLIERFYAAFGRRDGDAMAACYAPDASFSDPVFPLTFISSAFVPPASMPGALRWFADINPFTIVVNAMRALWVGAPAGNSIWGAVVWSLVLIAIFAPLAVWRYRRAAGR